MGDWPLRDLLVPLLFFVGGLLMTVVTTPVLIRLVKGVPRWDGPVGQQKRTPSVPRLGGIAVFVSSAVAFFFAVGALQGLQLQFAGGWSTWLSVMTGASLVFALGLSDDLRPAPYWLKFAVQIIAASIVVVWGGFRIQLLDGLPEGGSFVAWTWVPITLLWIVGVTNAFNLIDGLDALAAGIGSITFATLCIVALSSGNVFVALLAAWLAGSLVGFLRFNAPPARVYLGDSGSMFLGFVLAILAVSSTGRKPTISALFVPVLMVGVPVFDTLYAMVRRLLGKVVKEGDWSPSALLAMFRADKAHIHHTLMEMGYTHRKAVVILYGLSAGLGLLALAAVLLQNDRVSFGLMVVGAAAFFVMKKYSRLIPFLSRGTGREK